MNFFIKILSFLLLGIGAFIVYGAKLIASHMHKVVTTVDNIGCEDISKMEGIGLLPEESGKISKSIDKKPGIKPEWQIVNIKITGILFVIAGVILIVIIFG